MCTPERILICRSDRTGDLLLTLPLFDACRNLFPKAHIAALVSPSTASLLDGNPSVDQVILDDAHAGHKGPGGFMRLASELNDGDFDTALLPFCNWRLLSLVTSAGVKNRVANGFRAYLPLVNKPVWIHRSHPPIHETSYCLSFLEVLDVRPPSPSPARVYLDSHEKELARDFLSSRNIDLTTPLVGLHPGTGGPGRSLSPDRWYEAGRLAMELIGAETVIISGGRSERRLAERVAAPFGKRAVVVAGELNIRELCAVQSFYSVFLAPGCGPLYTAAAVGTPVLAFFPAQLALAAVKWRPLGDNVEVVQPEGPLCPRCRRHRCRRYDCMDEIPLSLVKRSIDDLLARARQSEGRRSAP